MAINPARTRFAPSPTGGMHLGNLRTALFNALLAWHQGGRFLLRIEDTDRARSEAHQAGALMADLQWLGLVWDEGPERDQPAGGAWQSGRGDVYAGHFERLETSGHAYPCFCGEAELARVRAAQRAAGQPPRYPGTCAALTREEVDRRRAAGEPATLRFRVAGAGERRIPDLVGGEHAFRPGEIGDFVIRRADGSAAFFFSNAVDDALMGVTHVLRGEDHLANTPRQLLLLAALGLPAPAYGHLPLVLGADGRPLAKREGAASLAELQAAGYRPEAVINHLARIGFAPQSDELLAPAALAARFDLRHVGRAAARHDPQALAHWQRLAVEALDATAFLDWLRPHRPDDALELPVSEAAFAAAVRPNVRLPADAWDWARRLFSADAAPDGDAAAEIAAAGPGFFATAATVTEPAPTADFRGWARAVGAATGAQGRALYKPLRAALTGAVEGPELHAVVPLLPPELVERRLRRAAGA